jgi:hypothetical protein
VLLSASPQEQNHYDNYQDNDDRSDSDVHVISLIGVGAKVHSGLRWRSKAAKRTMKFAPMRVKLDSQQ